MDEAAVPGLPRRRRGLAQVHELFDRTPRHFAACLEHEKDHGYNFEVPATTEIGRINPNLTIIAAGTVLLAVVLLIAAILLYSLVSVVRENNQK